MCFQSPAGQYLRQVITVAQDETAGQSQAHRPPGMSISFCRPRRMEEELLLLNGHPFLDIPLDQHLSKNEASIRGNIRYYPDQNIMLTAPCITRHGFPPDHAQNGAVEDHVAGRLSQKGKREWERN